MIQELDGDGVEDCVTSKELEAPCTSKSPTKRSLLEVDQGSFEAANKYKKFMMLKQPLETKRLEPSATLSKIKDFLPFLKESTDKLMTEYKLNPDLVNMESNVDEDEQHIEMNLAYVPESDSESEEETEEESDEESEGEAGGEENDEGVSGLKEIGLGFTVKDPNNKKLRLAMSGRVKAKNRPVIEVIEDGQDHPTTSQENEEEEDDDEEQD